MRKEFHGILLFNIRGWSQAWSVTSKVTVFSSLFWFCINDNRVRWWLLRCIEHLLSTRNRTWFFMRLITLNLHNLLRAELLSPRVTPSWSGTRSVLFTTRITFFDDLARSRAVDIRSTGRTQCEQHLLCTKHCVCCFTFVISFNLTYEKNGAEISEKLITLSRAPMDVTC